MTRLQRLPNFQDLQRLDPDKYNDLLNSYGITQEKIDAFQKNSGNYQAQLNSLKGISSRDRTGASNESSGQYKSADGRTFTNEDINHTLQLHPEYTREKLLQKLGVGQ